MPPQSVRNKKTLFLKRRGDFLRTYKGKSVRGESFTIFYVKNTFGSMRYGVTVPKRVGPAVIRNKYKRWVREFFRKIESTEKTLDMNIRIETKKITKEEFKKMNGREFIQKVEEAAREIFRK